MNQSRHQTTNSPPLSKQQRYGTLPILIHWLMALGILTAFGAGLYMVDIPGITPDKLRLYNWHKWLGVCLLAAVGLRLLVRLASRRPAWPAHWSSRDILLAEAGHWVLYLLMFAVPVFGYLFSLSAGFPVVLFGVIDLPVVIEKNLELKPIFKTLHELSAKLLVLLVLGHVLMALKHHFKDKDRILARMIPGLNAQSEPRAQRASEKH